MKVVQCCSLMLLCCAEFATYISSYKIPSTSKAPERSQRRAQLFKANEAMFSRENPMSDKLETSSFHHIEFYTGDATSTSKYFMHSLGLDLVSRSDLSTGNKMHISQLVQSGQLKFLFTAPLNSHIPGDIHPHGDKPLEDGGFSMPGFDSKAASEFFQRHGLGVKTIAVSTKHVTRAYQTMVANGARSATPPTILVDKTGLGCAEIAELQLYGDVTLRLVNTDNFKGHFLPNFQDVDSAGEQQERKEDHTNPSAPAPAPVYGKYGINRIDHCVGNLWEMEPVIQYIKGMLGFHDFAEFVAEDVGTVNSGLNSVVLANNNEFVLLPLNEPVYGTKRVSQIETYLVQNKGEGVQHLALFTDDIFSTLEKMQRANDFGTGFEFMSSQADSYYDRAVGRVGTDILTEEQYALAKKYGVLIDRDNQGILLQIFTRPVGDRPTIFIEIIQRIGCKDAGGIQKPGCGGFGKGNFKDLFQSIEDYETTLNIHQDK